ncbi:acyl-CoA dehydrogenase [Cohnella sp. 56]|uniref:acyl-CoA dehydrogenase n=1 Tax=Cohnella sp. 56 TaxID=3113722 RepID=UPI0030E7B528
MIERETGLEAEKKTGGERELDQARGISQALSGRVQAASLSIEREGRLPSDIVEMIYEERLFKLFVPDALGGRMTALPEAARIFEQAAYIDGSFGWLVTIGSGGGFFAATLPEPTAEALFSDRRAVIAGSGHPTGTATAVPGGYRVSGSWQYCSGAGHASFFTANCRVERDGAAVDDGEKGLTDSAVRAAVGDGEQQDIRGDAPEVESKPPEIRSFAFLPDQVEIVQDWAAMGLKATESHTIRVTDAFVPEERTFDIATPPRYGDPVYRYPFLPFAQVSFAAVAVGLGRRFLDEARRLADAKRVAWDRAYAGRYARVADQIAARRRELDEVVDVFYRETEESWTAFVERQALSDDAVASVGAACRAASRTATACAHALLPMLGMTGLMEHEPVNRAWRDLHTAAQHGLLNG